jgi:predicted amidohydrolase YtcJ
VATSRRSKVSFHRLTVLLLAACSSPKEPPADLVIRNTTIYTAARSDSSPTILGSIAVRGDRIVYVGPDSGAATLIGDETRTIDGTGGLVTPGFIDYHLHPSSSIELMECDLSDDSTVERAIASVRRCAEARPEAKWIRGTGWQLPVFPQGNPTARMLDQAVADRPAYLTAADGHSAWVNSRALELAGLTSATLDPPNGRIERDARGAPTGTLRESATLLVARLLPPYRREDYVRAFTQAFELATSLGITAVTDANADSAMLEAYRWMDSAGVLPVRVTAAQDLGPVPRPGVAQRVKRWRDRYRGRLVSANSAKIFMDGVIETRTAALLAPYQDRPGYLGDPALPQPLLDSLVDDLHRAGVQIHVHAIGDRAIRMTLDAIERTGARGARHQLAHLELIDPADIPRFKELGVLANFQPLWAYDDPYIVDLTIPAVGEPRSRWLYPLQSVLATGAVMVAGSDWSVSSMNPLEAIQVATTRRALDGGPGTGWIPAERVNLPDILAAYTINGAFARFADRTTGSLEVGKLADLVLLDRNLFSLPLHQIAETKVLLTVMDGRIRYHRSQPSPP